MKRKNKHHEKKWKKLLTFGALGWVKSTQIFGKIGTNSPLKRHGERRSSAKMVGSGWGEEDVLIKGNLVPVNRSNRHKVAPFSAG